MLNLKKAQCMVLTKRKDNRNVNIKIESQNIEQAGKAKFMRIIIDSIQFQFQFITSLLLYFTKICIHKLISMIQLNIVIQSAFTRIIIIIIIIIITIMIMIIITIIIIAYLYSASFICVSRHNAQKRFIVFIMD